MSVLDAVRCAYAAGLCPLPTRDDGTKAPAVPSWKPYQTARPTPEQMRGWGFEWRHGFGIIAGPVSGHRECWDFDTAEVYHAFVAAADGCGLGDVVRRIIAGFENETPGGGRRWIVTAPGDVPIEDVTLARRPGRDGEPPIKTLIELPTFAIVAPSNGGTHPSGKAYIQVSGGFGTIASYTAEERDGLLALARTFDQMPRRTYAPPTTKIRTRATTDDLKPGEDYNARAQWADLLPDWVEVFTRNETTYLRRPGKAHGISATLNHGGSDLLYVFTSSTAFDPDVSYSKFGAYALLQHGGDFRAAGKALYGQGYGTRPTVEVDPPSPVVDFARPASTEGLGGCVLQPRPAQPYSGWFMRGGVHLVAGSSGAGKSTLVLDLLQQQARGGAYLGHVGARLDFLVIFADRGKVSNDETLERMRIVPGSLPMAHIPPVANGEQAITAIRQAIEAEEDLPAVVFLEGADMLVEDASKTQIVAPFMGALRQLAEHYNLALVLSVGSPKAKPHEQYALKRDQVFGSQAWSRLANDVLVLSITGDGSVPTRDLVVLHRNAAAEKFSLAFENGRLVETDPLPASDADMVAWFAEAEVFPKYRFRERFSMSNSRATQLLDGYVAIGVLREKTKNDKTVYVYRRTTATSTVSGPVPKPDTSQIETPTPESVQKTDRTGHENARVVRGKPKESAPEDAFSLIPLKTQSGVRSVDISREPPDTGLRFEGYTRAREAEGDVAGEQVDQLPAWVTEPGDPTWDDPVAIREEAELHAAVSRKGRT